MIINIKSIIHHYILRQLQHLHMQLGERQFQTNFFQESTTQNQISVLVSHRQVQSPSKIVVHTVLNV